MAASVTTITGGESRMTRSNRVEIASSSFLKALALADLGRVGRDVAAGQDVEVGDLGVLMLASSSHSPRSTEVMPCPLAREDAVQTRTAHVRIHQEHARAGLGHAMAMLTAVVVLPSLGPGW